MPGTEMRRLQLVSFVYHGSPSWKGVDLHEEAVQAEANHGVVAVFSLSEDDNVESECGHGANKLEYVGEDHGPWCQRLGSEFGDFVDGGEEADQGKSNVDRLPPEQD